MKIAIKKGARYVSYKKKNFKEEKITIDDVDRSDPKLIKAIECYNATAWPAQCEFDIIEIPDEVSDWAIVVDSSNNEFVSYVLNGKIYFKG